MEDRHSWQKLSSADGYCLGAKALTEKLIITSSTQSCPLVQQVVYQQVFTSSVHLTQWYHHYGVNHHDNVNTTMYGLHKIVTDRADTCNGVVGQMSVTMTPHRDQLHI